MASTLGIPLSKVSPAFLHANSTSHTWAFSAFAELIDNAYDPDVSASELLIDQVDIRDTPCLIFLDNGAGMDRDHLLKMLSFGFCEKDIYERQGSHQPIGHYGNGFKSGSMRLGQDALVFTRCQRSASIGFLSQTYLKAIQTDLLFVTSLMNASLERIKSQESRNNLNAILQYSVFKDEEELKAELRALEGSKTGTKIIIYNLKRLQDGTYELDFYSDPTDIRCPEAHEVDMTSVYHRPIQQNSSEYKRSLREYCSILFLRPRMKITIRGIRVKSKLISKSLSNTEIDMYKPTWLSRPVKIIFGFTCEKDKSEDYGMMLYHRNRLIKAYEKVGYQKQPNELGVGVVGVAQVDFLQPIHNKQDFNKDEKFNSVMAAFANKLNDYWNEKKTQQGPSQIQASFRTLPDWLWAQCDMCLKWRRLPDGVDGNSLPEQWFCRMNSDATHNRCDIPEEPEDEDLAVRPTYEKTFKKRICFIIVFLDFQFTKITFKPIHDLALFFQKRKMIEKERELQEKEAALRAIQHVASNPDSQALTSLQKELAAARQREEQQRRVIQQMEEQRKLWLQMAESLQNSKGKKPKEVIEQMSQIIGTISPYSSLGLPTKRKQAETAANNKGAKQMCIKTETGEVLSITQNDINSQDDEDNEVDEAPRFPRANKLPSTTNKPQEKEKPHLSTSPKKVASKTNTSNEIDRANVEIPATAETCRSRKKSVNKENVVAVIDLTGDREFGELVDIKPDLDELRTTLQENLRPDIKPDKDKLDEQLSGKGSAETNKDPTAKIIDEAKEEVEEHQTVAPNLTELGCPDGLNVVSSEKDDSVHSGRMDEEPEFPTVIPDSFNDTLEAAIAAIQERMEKEKCFPPTTSSTEDTSAQSSPQEHKKELKEITTTSSKKRSDSESSLESLTGMIFNSKNDADKNELMRNADSNYSEKEVLKTDLDIADTSIPARDPEEGEEDNYGDEGSYDAYDDDSDYRDDRGEKGDVIGEKKECKDISSRSNSTADDDDSHRGNGNVVSDMDNSCMVKARGSVSSLQTLNSRQEMKEKLTTVKDLFQGNDLTLNEMIAACEKRHDMNTDSHKDSVHVTDGFEDKPSDSATNEEPVPATLGQTVKFNDKNTNVSEFSVSSPLNEAVEDDGVCTDHLSNEQNQALEMSVCTLTNALEDLDESDLADCGVGSSVAPETLLPDPAGLSDDLISANENCDVHFLVDASPVGEMLAPNSNCLMSQKLTRVNKVNCIDVKEDTQRMNPATDLHTTNKESYSGFSEQKSPEIPAQDSCLPASPSKNFSSPLSEDSNGDSRDSVSPKGITNAQENYLVEDVELGESDDNSNLALAAAGAREAIQASESANVQLCGVSVNSSGTDITNLNNYLHSCDKVLNSPVDTGNFFEKETQTPMTIFSEAEIQTDTSNDSDLHTKLKTNERLLEETKERLTRFHQDVHRLLQYIVSDTDLGDVNNIEQMVKQMLEVNEESF
ncbi:unnamed protein product [Lymnaea stagnalis]|uniref:CW-type domain-containing protein n=1 Tax=Lymnaea stagnalis TaxID=6523 RepID=A0AAV2IIL4_LYMST